MHFQKQDLNGDHYHWSITDIKSPYMGQPSRRSFDRYNGEQVLFLINSFGSVTERFSIDEGKVIEQEIMHRLPLEAKSEISVFNWIRQIDFTEKEKVIVY